MMDFKLTKKQSKERKRCMACGEKFPFATGLNLQIVMVPSEGNALICMDCNKKRTCTFCGELIGNGHQCRAHTVPELN